MANLEITSTQIQVQAKRVINGNTVNFSWGHQDNETPKIISFNMIRGSIGEPNYTGNIGITGVFYRDTKKFDIQNNCCNDEDFELYPVIFGTCKEIVTALPEE